MNNHAYKYYSYRCMILNGTIFTEHSLERCKSMEVHSTTTIHRSVNKSLRITSVRRHGGGGFAGHNIEKEVNITLRQSFLLYLSFSTHIVKSYFCVSGTQT